MKTLNLIGLSIISVLFLTSFKAESLVVEREIKTTIPVLNSTEMDAHGIVVKQSHVDVKTTMDRLEKIISKKEGLNLFNRINHAENSRNAGNKDVLDSELIIFGNPKVGLKMLSKDPKSGLDLPLKIVAYQDKDGKVYIAYRSVSFYSTIYDLKDCKAQAKMNANLNKISDIIIKSPKDFKAFMSKSK